MADDELAADREELDRLNHLGTMAEFVVEWRDYDDQAIRACGLHLPAAVRKLYAEFGHQFSVEVRLLNESAGFPCEHYEHLPEAGEGGY